MKNITYNIETLKGFCNDDFDSIKSFLSNYVVNAQTDLTDLRRFYASQQLEDVKNTAHKMKNIISLLDAQPCNREVNTIMNWEQPMNEEFEKRVFEFIENVEILFKKIQADYQL